VWAAELVYTAWRAEKSCPYWDSNSDPSTIRPVANHCELCIEHKIDFQNLISVTPTDVENMPSLIFRKITSLSQHFEEPEG
jgi:hypothetical protein